MEFELHPEALKRMEELSNGLLQLVVAQPSAPDTSPAFTPDYHPIAKLSESDIIGFGPVSQSIVDFAGNEVGRTFRHNGHEVGLKEDGFNSLRKLVSMIQRLPAFGETMSTEFLTDTTFDWIRKLYTGEIKENFPSHLVKAADESVESFQICIPLYRVFLQHDLNIGDIKFQVLTRDMFDAWENSAKSVERTNAERYQEFLNRRRADLQGCAAVVVDVRAERQRAVELARECADDGASLLRFLSPANWDPTLRSYCAPVGQENIVRTAEFFLEEGQFTSLQEGAIVKGPAHWILGEADLQKFSRSLKALSGLRLDHGNDFRKALYDALLIYSRNSTATQASDKLVFILVAIEAMLIRNTSEPLQKNIGERMAFLIGKNIDERKDIATNVAQIYQVRSSFIHHGTLVREVEALRNFMANAWTCFHTLLLNAARFSSREELIVALEDRKFA